MKKSVLILCLLFVIPVIAFGAGVQDDETDDGNGGLVIYAYDSFVSEWGPGPVVIPIFEEKYGIDVTLLSMGDAGQVLSRAVLEKDNPQADIILGIDNNLLPRALKEGVLAQYRSPRMDAVPEKLDLSPDGYLTPFDYGYFAVIYDSERIENPPVSMDDLADERFSNSLILMDPRTSSPGLGFFLWVISEYGEQGYLEYFRKLEASILTVTEGWDSGYGLFTQGEAPLVLSYTTSPAYHVEYENTDRYRAAVFPEGHYMQIEGLGITAGAKNREAAELFIDFALSAEFQSVIPLTNWMFPVVPGISLPESYDYAPRPEESILLDPEQLETPLDNLIRSWVTMMGKIR
ncbi:MAG: thiamine ABC transporter substrate binding subunit [Spirochaetia bacterium]